VRIHNNLGSTLSSRVVRERSLFHATMNAGLFEGLQRCSLRVSQSGLSAALREGPATSTGLDQQKLDLPVAQAVANCRNLLASTHRAQLGRRDELTGPEWADFRTAMRQSPFVSAHEPTMRDPFWFWLE
jgi:hypothetical protein